MGDITGLFGSGAPQASSMGLDPAYLAQLQAQIQAGQNSLSQAAATPSPQDVAAAQQAQAPQVGGPGQAGGLPQVKPGLLDYIMGGLFEHASPMEINAAANHSNLAAQMQMMRLQNEMGGVQDWNRGTAGQSQPPASQGPQDPSQATGMQPMGMIGSGAPSLPSNGGSFSGVPTMAQRTAALTRIAMSNPALATFLQKQAEDSQPSYQIVNGRRVITNDASAPANIMPADDGTTGYVPNASSPLGYSAVATPNAAAVKASAAALTDYAKGQVAAPMPGAQATGLSFDPVTGLPKASGFQMAPGAGEITTQDARDKAEADAAAKAKYDFFGQPTDASGAPFQGSKYQAANGAGAPGPGGIPTYGPNAAKLGYDADRAKAAGTQLDSINKDGEDAQSQINSLNALKTTLAGVQSGKLAPTGLELASTARAAGLPGNWDKVGNAEAAKVITGSMLGAVKSQMGFTRLTDADLKIINSSLPSITNSPQGNAQAISYLQAMAQRRLFKQQYANTYAKHYGHLEMSDASGSPNFNAAYAKYQTTHPMFGGQ